MDISRIENIGFIGAGKMAEGIMKGLIESGLIHSGKIIASDINPDRLSMLSRALKVKSASNIKIAQTCDVVFLAVKPQQADSVFKELKAATLEGKVILSIMAGVPTHRIEGSLKPGVHVIRVMPNIAATVQAAASAFCRGRWATVDDAALARTLLETFGTADKVEEKLLDAITGLSGSGPAYVFAFIEALADGGVRMGLPRDTALTLAAQTVKGAAKMLLETGEHPAVLRDRVTSPAGTTSYGLAEMEKHGFKNSVIQAVISATERSRVLGQDK